MSEDIMERSWMTAPDRLLCVCVWERERREEILCDGRTNEAEGRSLKLWDSIYLSPHIKFNCWRNFSDISRQPATGNTNRPFEKSPTHGYKCPNLRKSQGSIRKGLVSRPQVPFMTWILHRYLRSWARDRLARRWSMQEIKGCRHASLLAHCLNFHTNFQLQKIWLDM